ncbi:MAG: helix-turn-helix domain-containing protein [Methylococcus sp.]|nr:helix-turn-helix domain-containing protein [Methylococcus sp.]
MKSLVVKGDYAMIGKGVVFSSADLPEKERFDIWREMFSKKMLGFDISHVDSRPFFTQANFISLGAVRVTLMTSTSENYHRSPSLIASDGRDDIALAICTAGSCEISQGRGRVCLSHREATLFDAAAVMEGKIAAASPVEYQQMVNFCLPRAELLRRAPRTKRLQLSTFYDQEALRLLLGYIKMIDKGNHRQEWHLNEIMGRHILDIIAFMLGDSKRTEATTGGVRAARLAAVVGYLEKHYREPGLSVEDIAAALKISKRYLYSLLDSTGESVTQTINRLRLRRAEELLSDSKYSHLGIAEIALDSGFADLSYFYRKFRQHFGEAPGAFRTRSRSISC